MNGSGPNITLVTAIFDIGRDKLDDFGRDFSFYIDNLCNLLKLDYNFVIYTDRQTKSLIKNKTKTGKNIIFVEKNIDDIFDNNVDIFSKLEKVRNDKSWYEKIDWLSKSPQIQLRNYNPIVMSKIFILSDCSIFNFHNDDYLFWIDCGINNTVSNDQLSNIKNVVDFIEDKFLFVAFPYDTKTQEIHGFDRQMLENYSQEPIEYICRGGFFGGKKESIKEANKEYYDLLNNISSETKTCGTEESVFSILPLLNDKLYTVAGINSDGLIGKFFDDIKNNTVNFIKRPDSVFNKLKNKKTALYILTFECPDQLCKTLTSFNHSYDFLTKPHKIIVDNTENILIAEKNKIIAERFNCEYIKTNENLGVCGGRQFIAEHFDDSEFDFYFYFEDDMAIESSFNHDEFGFPKSISNLYKHCHEILVKEDIDFLKLNFVEFYGDSSKCWHFINLDKETREKYYPNRKKTINNLPNTEFIKIGKNENGFCYGISKNLYYSNWPCLFTKKGNKKLFIDEKLDRPHEQMWMAKNFKLQMNGDMICGVLFGSPIRHERRIFYKAGLRKEN